MLISCKNALDGTYYDNGYKGLPNEKAEEVFLACRNFVENTARGNRKQRIHNASLTSVKPCGILNRLVYNTETKETEYICGQEWYSEMATLRDIFDRRQGK